MSLVVHGTGPVCAEILQRVAIKAQYRPNTWWRDELERFGCVEPIAKMRLFVNLKIRSSSLG